MSSFTLALGQFVLLTLIMFQFPEQTRLWLDLFFHFSPGTACFIDTVMFQFPEQDKAAV